MKWYIKWLRAYAYQLALKYLEILLLLVFGTINGYLLGKYTARIQMGFLLFANISCNAFLETVGNTEWERGDNGTPILEIWYDGVSLSFISNGRKK